MPACAHGSWSCTGHIAVSFSHVLASSRNPKLQILRHENAVFTKTSKVVIRTPDRVLQDGHHGVCVCLKNMQSSYDIALADHAYTETPSCGSIQMSLQPPQNQGSIICLSPKRRRPGVVGCPQGLRRLGPTYQMPVILKLKENETIYYAMSHVKFFLAELLTGGRCSNIDTVLHEVSKRAF